MRFLTIQILLLIGLSGSGQFLVRGTVFDSTKQNYVEGVKVMTSSGLFCTTDTMGRYSIWVNEHDSLVFQYNNKPTQKFPVKSILNTEAFDISIKTKIQSKYKVLKEVIVYGKTYKEDSVENRMEYAEIFGYQKPGLYSSSVDGMSGFDLNQIVNAFRFKRNERLRAFQERLQEEEKERFVNMRFNKIAVSRITGLKDNYLDSFMVRYRPTYSFASNSNEVDFVQYILNASYQFRYLYHIPGNNPLFLNPPINKPKVFEPQRSDAKRP